MNNKTKTTLFAALMVAISLILVNVQYAQAEPVPATQVFQEGNANGHSNTTLNRAKQQLGIKPSKEGFGNDGVWYWWLPE